MAKFPQIYSHCSRPRVQHTDVQSWVKYNSAILAPLNEWVKFILDTEELPGWGVKKLGCFWIKILKHVSWETDPAFSGRSK